MQKTLALTSTILALLAYSSAATTLAAEGSTKISFKKTQLEAKFRSEGVAVGDFNHDGKLDIAAGSVYYASPSWDMQLVQDKALEFDPLHYSGSFCNYA